MTNIKFQLPRFRQLLTTLSAVFVIPPSLESSEAWIPRYPEINVIWTRHLSFRFANRKPRFITYRSNWNRRPGGFPASYFNSFMRGTETSLQIFRIFINSLGAFQSLFDSQVTFTQVVFFSQEHTFWSRPVASASSVRYQVVGLSLPSSKCTLCTIV